MGSNSNPGAPAPGPSTPSTFVKRHAPRVDCAEMPVRITVGQPEAIMSASMINISSSGSAVVVLERPLANVGDVFLISFEIERSSSHMMLPCRLRYVLGNNHPDVERQKWLHGASFESLDSEATAFVDNYVRERLRTASVH